MIVCIINRKTQHNWFASLAEAYYCYKSHQVKNISHFYTVLSPEGDQLGGLELVRLMYKERQDKKAKESKNV